jgi:hypothetical protein
VRLWFSRSVKRAFNILAVNKKYLKTDLLKDKQSRLAKIRYNQDIRHVKKTLTGNTSPVRVY